MEIMVMNMEKKNFWRKKRVLITGHTGFKGAWLSIWLMKLGAEVFGYALKPPTSPSLFDLCGLDKELVSGIGDVRDAKGLSDAVRKHQPEIVFHLAAQPLVLESYRRPVETYETNIMGTAHLLEAVRQCESVSAVVVVTTDKCYENREWHWGYRENDPLGGHDPYSVSKACAELITDSYRRSFFSSRAAGAHGAAIASARAGNVIGGGDWAENRLIPDCVRALSAGETISIRNPGAVRPWQHVLEPLGGYLLLAQKLCEEGARFAEAWNFGPDDSGAKPVEWMVRNLCALWGKDAAYRICSVDQAHEANYLKLDCSKAKARLNWRPRWDLKRALRQIVMWTEACRAGEHPLEICFKQIDAFEQTP